MARARVVLNLKELQRLADDEAAKLLDSARYASVQRTRGLIAAAGRIDTGELSRSVDSSRDLRRSSRSALGKTHSASVSIGPARNPFDNQDYSWPQEFGSSNLSTASRQTRPMPMTPGLSRGRFPFWNRRVIVWYRRGTPAGRFLTRAARMVTQADFLRSAGGATYRLRR